MPEPCPPALQPDSPAVGLPQLTLPVRLCDYADCRKPLHKCARASPTAPRTPGVRNITSLSRPLAQETGKHDQATRTTREHACTACQGACAHADARSRLRVVSFASHACVALPLSPRSLTHTAASQHKLTHENFSHPKPQTPKPKPQSPHCKPGTLNPKA